MTSTQPLRSGLVARTRRLDTTGPLLDWLGAEGFAWAQGRSGFVTDGVAMQVAVDDAVDVLRSIDVDDEVQAPGTGPIALGALPFTLPARAALTVPARVVGVSGGGAAWITELGPVAPRPRVEHPPPTQWSTSSSDDLASWGTKVRDALARIDRGELRKVVLAREVVVEADVRIDRDRVLAHLLATQPDCYAYAAPDFVGASPELLVQRLGAGVVSRPMAGTVARGADARADTRAIATLRESAKDAFEHQLVVDAVVDTLSESCVDVHAPTAPDVARLATVAHLATTITARVRDASTTALDLALALHPTPAVAGSPTEAALALIRELEGFDRGRYAGPVGWVDAHGDGEWVVALRGAELDGRRARVRAGAGIVTGSDPAAEWTETEAKLASVLDALLHSPS